MKRFLLILLFLNITGAKAQEAVQTIPYDGYVIGLTQSSDGNYMLFHSGIPMLYYRSYDLDNCEPDCNWKLRLIETASGVEIASFDDKFYTQYFFNSDNSEFVLVSPTTGDFAKHIEIRASHDGSLIREFDLPEFEVSGQALYLDWSSPVWLSADFSRLIHVLYLNYHITQASIWNTETAEAIYSLSCDDGQLANTYIGGQRSQNEQYFISNIDGVVSPDGRNFIFGCNSVVNPDANVDFAMIDVETGARIFSLPALVPNTSFVWDANSQYFAASEGNAISFFEGEARITSPQFDTNQILFLLGFTQPASHFIVLYSQTVLVFDIEANIMTAYDDSQLVWQQGTRLIVMEQTESRRLRFQYIELDSGQVLSEGISRDLDGQPLIRRAWRGDNPIVNFCDYAEDGELILRTWDAESNSFFDTATGQMYHIPSGFTCQFYYSSDGRYFAFYTCRSIPLIVFDNLSHEIVYGKSSDTPDNTNCLGNLTMWQNGTHRLIIDNFELKQLEFYDFP